MSRCQYAGDWFPVGFFNLDIDIVRIMNTQYLEEELMQYHHHIVESWLCIEIYVIIEEAWFPDTSLRVCCCQPRTPAKLRSAVSRKICWLKKMCVIWKIIWFIMGSIRSSAEWLTRAQEQSKHCHMSRAREKIGREAKSRFSLCVRKHSTQVTSCRIRNTGTLAWKLSNKPTCCVWIWLYN